ncbi:hypothetical protein, variant [Saprolegnia diclina VS20]|uniref:Uncharacterized protein n=1 Tax=Saprolegnia diclina (strain VS20) TaxID=1156394 RepID=T0Q2G6_SAPDV|nr:hypothetical protein, variant [Saprolegnia diclina VS20]EQC32009.1 hypothetical protein, variant [Saprolegnia diclina VS20]|eukprot:XP_008614411.1 hypothetical protein, variant [Saprolegnia diclina VS20]
MAKRKQRTEDATDAVAKARPPRKSVERFRATSADDKAAPGETSTSKAPQREPNQAPDVESSVSLPPTEVSLSLDPDDELEDKVDDRDVDHGTRKDYDDEFEEAGASYVAAKAVMAKIEAERKWPSMVHLLDVELKELKAQFKGSGVVEELGLTPGLQSHSVRRGSAGLRRLLFPPTISTYKGFASVGIGQGTL